MNQDLQALGTRVRNARLAKGLSLTDLAAKSGVSKGYLSALENGDDVNPTLDIFFKVAKALDVTLADILDMPKAKQKSAIPANLPSGLRQLIEARLRAGTPLDEETIHGLAHANFRGRRPRTKADFEWVLGTFERVARSSRKSDGED